GTQGRTAADRREASHRRAECRRIGRAHRSGNQRTDRGDGEKKAISEQGGTDVPDMDVEAFNEFAAEQGWSDGMPLYVPTEEKVAKFVDTVRGDNRPIPPGPPRQAVPTLQ